MADEQHFGNPGQGGDKDRKHDRDKDQMHDRDKDRQRDQGKDQMHDREKDRQRDQDEDRMHDGDRDRQRDQDEDRKRDPKHGRAREKENIAKKDADPDRERKDNPKDSGEFADPEDERSMEELHRAAMEKEEQIPEEGNERGPWWMYAIIIATLAFGFFYMGRYLGEISDQPHVLFTTPAPPDLEPEELDLMATGQRVYTRLCQSCHQQDGAGVPGAFPPLGGSDWVIGIPERPVYIVLQGFQGEIVREGVTYNAVMPGFGRLLSDEEVASVVTYIRNSFGNEAPEVLPEEVAEMREASADRATGWTESELDDFIESQEGDVL